MRPLAERALEGPSSLVRYLRESEVDVAYVESEPNLTDLHVTESTLLDFVERGACEILTYRSSADAEQFGPRSGGGGIRVRRTPTLGRRTIDTVHSRYKPTYRFGRFVAVCSNEPAQVAEALRKLQAYARSTGR